MRLNDSNTTDSLDPASFNATTMICVSRAFRDSLVEGGPEIADGYMSVTDAPGLGVTPVMDVLGDPVF